MYGLRVYPGIHLFIGRAVIFFFFPPVMNRISLEAYPLLPFISPFVSLPYSLRLSKPPPPLLSSKLKYCILKALVSELLLQSVSINDVKAVEGSFFFFFF